METARNVCEIKVASIVHQNYDTKSIKTIIPVVDDNHLRKKKPLGMVDEPCIEKGNWFDHQASGIFWKSLCICQMFVIEKCIMLMPKLTVNTHTCCTRNSAYMTRQ